MTTATPTKRPKQTVSTGSKAKASATGPGLLADLRALLLPEKKWHYVFHLAVILTALSYWIASGLTLPEASWEEIVMYRPYGDNQVYPVITALSRLNFGDPTDAFQYGKGVAGFHAVILFPHAMLYAVFGWAGYMLADVGFSWLYLAAIVLLLRRCNLGPLASLVLGTALATGSLQALSNQFNLALAKLVTISGGEMSEWVFPNLFSMQIFSKRIPRPMITESLMVFLLYGAVGLWREPKLPSLKTGLALGACMSLLMQGDPYSFSVLGLVFLAVVLRIVARNQWRWPWQFLGGAAGSALVVSSYFIYQMLCQEPDGAVRFGLYAFGRGRLMVLPGYGPLLRVGIVAGIAWLMIGAAKKLTANGGAVTATAVEKSESEGGLENADAGVRGAILAALPVAQFCVVLAAAAWLAQPAQVFLAGKGAQLYHYLIATLPAFYSYALVLLGCQALLVAAGAFTGSFTLKQPGPAGKWVAASLLGLLLTAQVLLGIEASLDATHSQGTARDEVNPWAQMGDRYRASFRGLDKAFREIPKLKQSRSFATFSHEVNFLLAAFHNKRAYLPDNGFTTLPDKELERRLFEVSKICKLNPGQFANLIQNMQVMNYWLGCAKYWFAVGHTFAPLSEYPEQEIAKLKQLGRQPVFSLVMPKNELERLTREYSDYVGQGSDVSLYPDAMIVSSILTQQGVVPNTYLYQTTYSNEVFCVYTKSQAAGTYSAKPE